MSPTILRPYQQKAIDDTRQAFRGGRKAPLIIMPVGSGKTLTAATMAKSAAGKGKRVLWVAHTRELVKQAESALDGAADVCTIQSKPSQAYDIVFIDEAHHYNYNTFSDRIREIPLRIGLTATPRDGMGDLFDCIVEGPSIAKLTAEGVLVPAEVLRPIRALRSGELAMHPVDAYEQHAPGRKAIVYALRVEEAERYAEEFKRRGLGAEVVHGGLSTRERDLRFRRHKTRSSPILVNCLIATEGYDDPEVDALILARGVGTLSLYLQIIGRGVRRGGPDKSKCILADLRGASHIFGEYTQDLQFSLEGDAIRPKSGGARLCPVCSSILGGIGICGACGWESDSDGANSNICLGLKLDKYAEKKAQPEAVKISDLANYMLQARLRGYPLGWALKKFEGIHEHPPPSHWIYKAKKLLP